MSTAQRRDKGVKMTVDRLKRANQIQHEIESIDNKIDRLHKMSTYSVCPSLYQSDIGTIILEKEWSYEVIDFVADKLATRRKELQDEFEKL